MSIRHAPTVALLAFTTAAAFHVQSARAQEAAPDLAERFKQICGTTGEQGPTLPGTDVAAADAPGFFAGDLQRAVESRAVKTDSGYAMRALVPSGFDPQHAVFLKCAVAARSVSFAQQVEQLSTMLSAKPRSGKTDQGLDYAQFSAGMTTYSVYSEPDAWVSIYKMEILMRNIDPKYLKKGAQPAPSPSVR